MPLPAPLPDNLTRFNGRCSTPCWAWPKEYSLFGNATYSVTPHSRSHRRPALLARRPALHAELPALDRDPRRARCSRKNQTIRKTTYLLSAIYKVDDKTAVYGRVASGFRPAAERAAGVGGQP